MFGWLKGKKAEKTGASSDLYRQAASFLLESLRIQMANMEGAEKSLPPVATDDFSLGYVAGYVESLSQFRHIDTEENGYAMYQIVFAELFGTEGAPLFARFMKHQQTGSEEIAMGMQIGGDDLFAWLNGDKETPDQWASYVNRN